MNVLQDSHAAKAGLKAGDVILKIGNRKVAKYREFVGELHMGGPDKEIIVLRGDAGLVFSVSFHE